MSVPCLGHRYIPVPKKKKSNCLQINHFHASSFLPHQCVTHDIQAIFCKINTFSCLTKPVFVKFLLPVACKWRHIKGELISHWVCVLLVLQRYCRITDNTEYWMDKLITHIVWHCCLNCFVSSHRNHCHLFYGLLRSSFKMFPELLFFWKIQNCKTYKLHLLQNSPLMQLYTSARDCKCAGNIPGSHLQKPFQLLNHILNDVHSITKAPSLQCWFQSRNK